MPGQNSSSSASSPPAPSTTSPKRAQLSPKDVNRGTGSDEYFALPHSINSEARRQSSSSSSSSSASLTNSASAAASSSSPSSLNTYDSSAMNAMNLNAPPSAIASGFNFSLPTTRSPSANVSSLSPSFSSSQPFNFAPTPSSSANSTTPTMGMTGSSSHNGSNQLHDNNNHNNNSKWITADTFVGWHGPQSGNSTMMTPSLNNTGNNHGFNFGSSSSSTQPAQPTNATTSSSSPGTSSGFRLQRGNSAQTDSIRGPGSSLTGSTTPLAQPAGGPSPFFPSSSSSSTQPASASSSSSAFTFSAPPIPSLPLKRPPSAGSTASSAMSISPTSNRPTAAPVTKFDSISASTLLDLLTSNATILSLDMRIHTSYLNVHLRQSINICVPSTLLRRPGYGIDRVSEGLPVYDQEKFATWSSCSNIVVFDNDSNSCIDSSPLASLLNKFTKANYAGRLNWIKGGWQSIKSEIESRQLNHSLLEYGSGEQPTSPDGSISSTGSGGADSGSSLTSTSKKHARPVLQVRDLPIAAFQQSSTSAFVSSGGNGMIGGRPTNESSQNTRDGDGAGAGGGGGHERSESHTRPGVIKRRKSGYAPYSHHSKEGANDERKGRSEAQNNSQAPTTPGDRRMATNPFFDNIRQNSEALSLTRMLENLSPIEFETIPLNLKPRLPPFLSALLDLPPFERARVLAYQFYELESAERKRLQGALHWHTNVQGKEDGDHPEETKKYEKFGISAGVELGSLNRFKNIFPYEHARVRLQRHAKTATDYVNASHIQLAGSRRRFIASQGPLPSTFADFWQTCDQHQVGVVVMLTNLMENGREKCGRYWGMQPSGDWVVEVTGGEGVDEPTAEASQPARDGGFFAPTNTSTSIPTTTAEAPTVRRTILVRRSSTPSSSSRKVRHIHYRAWPDFDIPASPYELVELVHEVERAQEAYKKEIGWNEQNDDPPIVVNCAAGCGRTGVFIIISTMLDMLRQQRRQARKRVTEKEKEKDKMEIDSPTLANSTSTLNNFNFSQAARFSTPSPRLSIPPQSMNFTPSSLIPDTASLSLNSPLIPPTSPPHGVPRLTPSPLFSNSASTSTPPRSSSSSPTKSQSQSQSQSHSSSQSTAKGPTLPLTLPDTPHQEPSLQSFDPVFTGVNEMREQRMSMVANYRQFVCVHECILVGVVKEMKDEEDEEEKTQRQ